MPSSKDSNQESRTPTELLVHCMEDFSGSEPKTAMVVWLNEAGDLCWSATTDSFSARIGMLELAKQILIRKCFELED